MVERKLPKLEVAGLTPVRRSTEKRLLRRTYKVVEVVGSSTDSIAHAVRNAVSKASETLRNVEWVEVGQIRGHVVDGELEHFQVATKIGFRLE